MRRATPDFEILQDTSLASRVRLGDSVDILKRFEWVFLVGLLVLNDLGMMALAFRAAYLVRFELAIPVFQLDVVPSELFYNSLIRFLIPLWVTIFAAIGLYNRENLLGGTKEYSMLFNTITIGMFSVIAFGFLQTDFVLARGWLLLAWFFAFLFTAIGRFFIRRIVYAARNHGYFLNLAIIVGANNEGLSIAEQLIGWKRSGLQIVGFVDNRIPSGKTVFRHLTSLGSVECLDDIIQGYGVKEVIVSRSAFTREELVSIFKNHGISDEVNLSMSSGLYEVITTGMHVHEMASVPLVTVDKVRLKGIDLLLKTVMDYLMAGILVVLLSPVYLLLALVLRLDSPGPVIHRRRVMGVNGKQFDAFKFRSMYVDGDKILEQNPELKAELEANQKLKVDPRVTKMGAFLRKTSLDELPQLFNVLRNEMSVVGPRMISPEEMKKYNQWGINLLTVKPGITGLWQVSGRSDVSYDERVHLDMQYIRNWNIWLDIKLLIETIPAVLSKRGAY